MMRRICSVSLSLLECRHSLNHWCLITDTTYLPQLIMMKMFSIMMWVSLFSFSSIIIGYQILIIYLFFFFNLFIQLVLSEEFQNKPINPMIFYLRKAVLKNYRKTHNEIYLVELFKKYKVVLEEIVAIPPPHGKALSSPIVLWSIGMFWFSNSVNGAC